MQLRSAVHRPRQFRSWRLRLVAYGATIPLVAPEEDPHRIQRARPVTRIWRWLTGRVTLRPRRVTLALWWLIFLFSNGISHLLERYSQPLQRADAWALLAVIPVGLALFAWLWWSGRAARKRR